MLFNNSISFTSNYRLPKITPKKRWDYLAGDAYLQKTITGPLLVNDTTSRLQTIQKDCFSNCLITMHTIKEIFITEIKFMWVIRSLYANIFLRRQPNQVLLNFRNNIIARVVNK